MATLNQFKRLGELHKAASKEKDPKKKKKMSEEVEAKRAKLQK